MQIETWHTRRRQTNRRCKHVSVSKKCPCFSTLFTPRKHANVSVQWFLTTVQHHATAPISERLIAIVISAGANTWNCNLFVVAHPKTNKNQQQSKHTKHPQVTKQHTRISRWLVVRNQGTRSTLKSSLLIKRFAPKLNDQDSSIPLFLDKLYTNY